MAVPRRVGRAAASSGVAAIAPSMSRAQARSGAPAVSSDSSFPLALSSNSRFLQTASGAPRLLNLTSMWGLATGLSSATAKAFLDALAAKGFNTALVCALCTNGDMPATITPSIVGGDYGVPNTTFFSKLDDIIAYAATKDFWIGLVPDYAGWWGNTTGSWDDWQASTDAKMAIYGDFLAQRYKNTSNVFWCLGGDQYPDYRDGTTGRSPAVAQRAHAMWGPIKTACTSQFFTGHLDSSGDSVRYQDSGMHAFDAAKSGAPGASSYATYFAPPWGLNGHYAFAVQSGTPVYVRDRDAYNLLVGGVPSPTNTLDPSYRGEPNGSDVEIRQREHRGMCEGRCGIGYNNGSNWYHDFDGAATSTALTQHGYTFAFWNAIPWWTLTPTTGSTHITSGRGTYTGDDYVCARASTAMLVAHIPDGGGNTITVDLSQFTGAGVFSGSGVRRLRKYDPTAGTYTTLAASLATSGSITIGPSGTYTLGTNSAGSTDWLVVVD